MAIDWWKVASAAGAGYTGAKTDTGVGKIVGSLLNRKKKKTTPSMTPSMDEAEELESEPYPGPWFKGRDAMEDE